MNFNKKNKVGVHFTWGRGGQGSTLLFLQPSLSSLFFLLNAELPHIYISDLPVMGGLQPPGVL